VKERPRALAVLIAVFLLGCIVGSGGSYFWLRKSLNPQRKDFQGFRPGLGPGRQSTQALLSLTDEQERQFNQIMEDSRRQIEAVRAENWPEIQAIFSKQQPQIQAIVSATNTKLMSILNGEQKKKFEAFLKEEMERRKGRTPFGGRGMGPQPGGQPPPPGGRNMGQPPEYQQSPPPRPN
jgi:Spy/CpxP family protein refolding chaperone